MTWVERVAAAYLSEPDTDSVPPTVDVTVDSWLHSLTVARDELGCDFFDFLSAVDNEPDGFVVVTHLVARHVGSVETVLLRTAVPADAPVLPCGCSVYAGAGWHERETHEMFGIDFGVPLEPLLLPDGFEGNPLRKEFVLASRVAKAWPGAKEPGESDADSTHSPGRRRIKPPGVPDPSEWGPERKGPPEPADE